MLPACSLEAGGESGAGVVPARGEILVDAIGFDTGLEHGVALRCQRLAAVALRGPDVVDEHGRETVGKKQLPGCNGALIVATGFLSALSTLPARWTSTRKLSVLLVYDLT